MQVIDKVGFAIDAKTGGAEGLLRGSVIDVHST